MSGASGRSRKSVLTSTIGSSVEGLSNSSTHASCISPAVATPQKWRHGSPRCERFFMRTRAVSLTCIPSARLLPGVAYGSCIRESSHSPVTIVAWLQGMLLSVVCGPELVCCAERSFSTSAATALPAAICEPETTSLVRRTITPRAMPVVVSSRSPSLARLRARSRTCCRSASKLGRLRACLTEHIDLPPSRSSASNRRCVSMTPDTSEVLAHLGVVLRVASGHTQRVWFWSPRCGCRLAGASTQAWMLVCAASSLERARPTHFS